MALTNKEKKWIDKNHSKFSPDKIAKELKLNKEDVEAYLLTFNQKPPTKLFYLILILIPVIFFVALEIGLRIFNYGYDFTQWVNVTDKKLILNPDIAHKYFQNTDAVPISNLDVFDLVKTDSTFRVFVLGGSSGAGYPFVPIGSFSRYIKERLKLVYPHSKIEVINCSMTAINSYSLRDFMPGILEQKPDLILIYAGHNEYYGALGIGSMESLGTSRQIVNLMISLEKYKTFQLAKNTIRWIVKLFSKGETKSGTLMSRMAENQYIGYKSDIYQKGIEQFEGNLNDILKMAGEKKIPVILGKLASNVKDQRPFVSIESNGYPKASEVYNKAEFLLGQGKNKEADSLFNFAKDLDALRFRAPSDINKIIVELGNLYDVPVINTDSAFNKISPDNIVGDNLMTDHLHPTLQGYKIIGDLFYKEMVKAKFLPGSIVVNLSNKVQDSLTNINFKFNRLDSVIGAYRIKLLKNDWPYVDKSQQLQLNKLLVPGDFIDSLAFNLMDNKINWEQAHSKAAEYYKKNKDVKNYLSIMDVLISEYPFILEYYDYAVNTLLEFKDYQTALKYLTERMAEESNDFSTKWVGIINLNMNNIETAKKYLLESLKFNENDAQVWYNLAGCYTMKEDYKNALESVNRSLKIFPRYAEAKVLQAQLQRAVKKK